MIDCHTLYLPNHNKLWLEDLKNDLVKEPVIHHLVPGIPNNITDSRKNGYAQGNNKYCSFIDDDDRVKEGIFTKFTEGLENSNASFIWAGEVVMCSNLVKRLKINRPSGVFKKNFILATHRYVHGVVVYRRELIEELLPMITINNDYMDWIVSSCMYVLGKVRGYNDPICLNDIGMYWRMHSNNTSRFCQNKKDAGIFITEFYQKMGLADEIVNLTYMKKVLK